MLPLLASLIDSKYFFVAQGGEQIFHDGKISYSSFELHPCAGRLIQLGAFVGDEGFAGSRIEVAHAAKAQRLVSFHKVAVVAVKIYIDFLQGVSFDKPQLLGGFF